MSNTNGKSGFSWKEVHREFEILDVGSLTNLGIYHFFPSETEKQGCEGCPDLSCWGSDGICSGPRDVAVILLYVSFLLELTWIEVLFLFFKEMLCWLECWSLRPQFLWEFLSLGLNEESTFISVMLKSWRNCLGLAKGLSVRGHKPLPACCSFS